MNSVWKNGIPSTPGVYWFNTGTYLSSKTLVLRVFNDGKAYFYGEGGSMPLDVVTASMKYAIISPPTMWGENISARTWVRHPDGYIGFGLLHSIDHRAYKAYGTIIWMNHPQQGEIHGGCYHRDKKYLYCNVKEEIISC